jgi:citronellol/citronellal dehydrogenase
MNETIKDHYKYPSLKGKVAIISGGSRGIGAATAHALARNGCHVIILGKTDKPHPKLSGTIHSVAQECQELYRIETLALMCDIRNEADILNAVTNTMKKFGQIDILINSASAIQLSNTLETDSKKFDLMMNINIRGTYLMSQACVPFLKFSDNAHIVNFAPPLTMNAFYFNKHLAYTISKYGMSMCTLGMAHEFYHDNIGVNSLWPRTIIKTAAIENLGMDHIVDKVMRKPEIMADAVLEIVTKPAKVCSGSFLIDDLVLAAAGVTDFDQYACEAGNPLMKDLFLPHDLPPMPSGGRLL